MSDNILVIPKVSIIIPIYNTAPFLRETLDSICNQSLKLNLIKGKALHATMAYNLQLENTFISWIAMTN